MKYFYKSTIANMAKVQNLMWTVCVKQ